MLFGRKRVSDEPSPAELARIDAAIRKSLPGSAVAKEEQPVLDRKRKVALFVAYLGAEYSGMQFNEGVKTIESELEAAIQRAGGISEQNAGDFYKVNWMRSARTDKGVSAVGQVVSLKMMIGQEDVVARINAQLPPDIVVLGYKRVIGSFDARHSCDRRRYEYIIPTSAFDPAAYPTRVQKTRVEDAAAVPSSEAGPSAAPGLEQPVEAAPADTHMAASAADVPPLDTKAEPSETTCGPTSEIGGSSPVAATSCPGPGSEIGGANVKATSTEIQAVSGDRLAGASTEGKETSAEQHKTPQVKEEGAPGASVYSFDAAQRARLNEILSEYVGTHNFHNFTKGTRPEDPSAKRYMIKVECLDVITLQGREWARIEIFGQSFMLHQIRKMIGLAVAVMRGLAPTNAVQLALEPRRTVETPTAPATGLFLDESVFACYNEKWGAERGEALSLADFAEPVRVFKETKLYPSIATQEAKEDSTGQFVRGLQESTHFRFSEWATTPLQALPVGGGRKRPGPGQASAALLVGAQESYGVRGSGNRGERRKRGRGGGRGEGGNRQKREEARPGAAEGSPKAQQPAETRQAILDADLYMSD